MSVMGLKMGIKQIGWFLKKHAPQICTTLGVGGFIGTAVLTGTAAVKAKDILDTKDDKIEALQSAVEEHDLTPEQGAEAEKALKKEVSIKLIKTFAKPVALGTVSTLLIFGGQGILGRRAAALATGLYETQEKIRKYRQRVVEELGPEVDKRLSEGLSLAEKDIPKKIQENLEKAKETSVNESDDDRYWFLFSSETCGPLYGCGAWRDDPEYNRAYLTQIQDKIAPDMLLGKGWLLVNDILQIFGHKGTAYGATHGWYVDPVTGEIPNIDFGLNDIAHNPGLLQFLNGAEPNVWLRFNCVPMGDMIDKIEAKQNYRRRLDLHAQRIPRR